MKAQPTCSGAARSRKVPPSGAPRWLLCGSESQHPRSPSLSPCGGVRDRLQHPTHSISLCARGLVFSKGGTSERAGKMFYIQPSTFGSTDASLEGKPRRTGQPCRWKATIKDMQRRGHVSVTGTEGCLSPAPEELYQPVVMGNQQLISTGDVSYTRCNYLTYWSNEKSREERNRKTVHICGLASGTNDYLETEFVKERAGKYSTV